MTLIYSQHYPSIFTLFYVAFILSCIKAAPTSSVKSFYSESISMLIDHHCKMPEEVYIPFSPNSDPSTFDFLATPLQKCQTEEAKEEKDEAHVLCKEIFEVLQNITCVEYTNASFPKINSSRLSDNVCTDFFDLRDVLPKGEELIASRLADKMVCPFLCNYKYESLCRILVWSYDVQAQIRTALESKAREIENTDVGIQGAKDITGEAQDMNYSNITLQPNIAYTSNEHTGTNLDKGSNYAPIQTKKDKKVHISTNSNGVSEVILSNSKNIDSGHTVQPKENGTVVNHQKDMNISTSKTSSQSEKSNYLDGAVVEANEPNIGMQTDEPLDSDKKSNQDIKDINPEEGQGKDNTLTKEPSQYAHSLNEDKNQNTNHLTSVINVNKNDQNEKSSDLPQANGMKKDTVDNNSVQTYANSLPSLSDNELNNVDFQEQGNENTIKEKQTNAKPLEVVTKNKNPEKPKETESAILNVITSDTPDLTTVQITLEKNDEDQAQEDRDQEQYNDTENEGDYPKEYENQQTKDKDSEAKNSISITSEVASLNGISNNFDPFLNPRNNLGSVQDDVHIVPSFPEQEDSHFFFYFLSIVLILMAGYLIFHNKQKIIALIVEGRHERRRRSHGAGYKKLETK